MKLLGRVAPVIAVLVAATSAFAQPGVDDPHAPLQNEPWQNVSHINGQVVKVGERGDYLIDYKKTNISSNPIGWMIGFYGLSLSHAITENFAIRADGNLFHFDNSEGYELGLTVPIYFKRVYQGPFLEGGLLIRDLHRKSEQMTKADVGPQVLFGWHWSFDSGANVAVALGSFRPMGGGKTSDDTELAGYFRVGYAY